VPQDDFHDLSAYHAADLGRQHRPPGRGRLAFTQLVPASHDAVDEPAMWMGGLAFSAQALQMIPYNPHDIF
jgi:hypothetical protein